jgi:hypothetical protein
LGSSYASTIATVVPPECRPASLYADWIWAGTEAGRAGHDLRTETASAGERRGEAPQLASDLHACPLQQRPQAEPVQRIGAAEIDVQPGHGSSWEQSEAGEGVGTADAERQRQRQRCGKRRQDGTVRLHFPVPWTSADGCSASA